MKLYLIGPLLPDFGYQVPVGVILILHRGVFLSVVEFGPDELVRRIIAVFGALLHRPVTGLGIGNPVAHVVI